MDFLNTILKEKIEFLKVTKKEFPQEKLINKIELPLPKSRFKSILQESGTHLIAEIKRASPSKGDLRPDLDIIQIAQAYEQGGVRLVSVLTEEKFFKGTLDDIIEVRATTSLSVLRKDFIIDNYQIHEAKIYGADAILLIASILTNDEMEEFLAIAKSLRLDVVVEIHNEEELNRILKLEPVVEIIGINHRNLKDFTIDLSLSSRLLPQIPKDKLVVAESGIEDEKDLMRLKKLGVNAVLVGESLMRDKDISLKLNQFIQALK